MSLPAAMKSVGTGESARARHNLGSWIHSTKDSLSACHTSGFHSMSICACVCLPASYCSDRVRSLCKPCPATPTTRMTEAGWSRA